jgi:hypothetical protein
MWSRIPWCETSINQQPVGMSIPIFAHLSMEAIGMQLLEKSGFGLKSIRISCALHGSVHIQDTR